VAVAAWLLLGAAGLLAHARIDDVTAAGESSFLPADAESTQAVKALQHVSGGGEEVPAVVVFERQGGLGRRDLRAIGRIGDGLDRLGLTGVTPVIDPFSGAPRYRHDLATVAQVANGIGPLSRDGEAALLFLAIDAQDRGAVVEGVDRIRGYLRAHARPGLRAFVTGPGGIAADLEAVASEAAHTLLFATVGLVLLLLLLVYRAPVLALLPLAAVAAAYLVAVGIAYLLIEAGWITVNAEGTMLLLVLIFGAGTDYSLLLVHRFREELALERDREGPRRSLPSFATEGALPIPTTRQALDRAIRETRGALFASAGTVIAAMLVLLVADLESTHWLGPILAIGIAVMLAAAFTLLPALLAILGERAFWSPWGREMQSRGSFVGSDTTKEPRDWWDRVAGLVRRRSGTIVVCVLALVGVLCLGNLTHHDTLGFGQGVTKPTDSSEGTEALERHFPAGLGSPLTAVVGAEAAPAVVHGMQRLDSVQLALPAPIPGDASQALVALVLHGNPYGSDAAEAVKEIRTRLHALAPGGLLGGIPAENLDVEQTNARDTKLIVPLVLLVVGLILIAVLRALTAPAYLIATVVLSFGATLGLATFAFTEVFATEGLAFNLELMAFIFLVALGVDYNIFLMTRAREEAAARGTREGVLAALVHTGGVVTGAGLILAGTFATLTLLPLEELVQIGATVAFGVLLDTFLVRALLIPAVTHRLGDRAWWPSRTASNFRAGGPEI
jgi:putative drug exporter of the RND superfamily